MLVYRIKSMQLKQSICLFILAFLFTEASGELEHYNQNRGKRSNDQDCCVSSKFNVAAKKANHGRDFFHKLAGQADSYKLVNPENMCNLMHFLMQQAKLNNKSVSFTKGKLERKDIKCFT